MPAYGFMRGIHRVNGGGYGKQLKDDYRRYYGAFVHFAGRGECLPSNDNSCEIDPEVVDRWGIPVLRFRWKWSQAELNQARHMQKTFRTIVDAMGGKPIDPDPGAEGEYGISTGGEIIHEIGTVRMGRSPRTSVLNEWCQAHDCRNLFVADGGPFVSNPHKNGTWTILALAMRTAEHVAEERRKGNL
jgi:choline dehydrogenase-like flavoprotein